MPSMFTLLKQSRMCWLSHVVCMDNGWIPKDLLYKELTEQAWRFQNFSETSFRFRVSDSWETVGNHILVL